MRKLFYLLLLPSLTACSSLEKDLQVANSIAVSGQLKPVNYLTKTFTIKSWQTQLISHKPLTIYIEGDGMAWLSRNQISPDPTPNEPIALSLATIEAQQYPESNVIYLARPCQYTTREENPLCHSKYWGKARYSREVLNSYQEILNQLSTQHKPSNIHLVGYSGGAAIALWLATQRSDIHSVMTIAGNVNPTAFSRLHNVDELTESEDLSTLLKKMPSIVHHHFIGAQDKVVPTVIAESMIYLLPEKSKKCARISIVEGADHTTGWTTYWKTKLQSISQLREKHCDR